MTLASALIVFIALSVYGSCARAQGAAAATGQEAHDVAATNDAATTDEALTKAVYAALNADPNYYFRHVTVRVDKGVANLSGFGGSSAAINRARTIASKVAGVTRVATNQLQVDTRLLR
jgi:BON domain